MLVNGLWLAALALLQAGAANDSAPVPVARTTAAWRVVREGETCVLRRVYGTVAQPVTLALRRSPVGDWTTLFIGRAGRGERNATWGTTQLDDGEARYASVFRYPLPAAGREGLSIVTYSMNLTAVAPNAILRVRTNDGLALAFDLNGLGAAWPELDKCNAGLLAAWGIAEPATVATPAKRLRMPWLLPQDYPDISLMDSVAGETVAVFMQGADGRVRNCRIGVSSGVFLLDRAACAAIERNGRVEPARNADGAPVATAGMLSVQWKVAQ